MNQMLSGVDRAQIIKAVAIYFVIAGILSFCGGIALFGLGGFAGIMGAGSAAVVNQSGAALNAEDAAAVSGLAGMGVLTAIMGIIAVVLAPVLLVVAWGLFGRKAWARQGTIIVSAISVIESLLTLGNGGSIVTLIISGFVLYLFLTDEGIKMELSQ